MYSWAQVGGDSWKNGAIQKSGEQAPILCL